MNLWLLTRWEGDYDIVIGIYSNQDKAEAAAQLHVNAIPVGHMETYNLFEVELDALPPIGQWARIKPSFEKGFRSSAATVKKNE